MLRYSRQLLSPLAVDGISLASFWPIVENCSLIAYGKSVVLFRGTPFTISSLIVARCKFVYSLPGASRVMIFVLRIKMIVCNNIPLRS